MIPTIQIRPVPIVGLNGPRNLPWRPGAVRIRPKMQMGQGKGAIAAFGVVPMLFSAAAGAGLGWIGFSTGSRESGILSILGYVYGVLGVLGAVGGVLGAIGWVAGVSMIPERNGTPSPSQPVPSGNGFTMPEMPEIPDFGDIQL